MPKPVLTKASDSTARLLRLRKQMFKNVGIHYALYGLTRKI